MHLNAPGPQRLLVAIERSDLGKFMMGKNVSREDRGTPAITSSTAFKKVAATGFIQGKDKTFNVAMRDALELTFKTAGISCNSATAEQGLGFCDLIPDNAFGLGDGVTCVEYTWRTASDFLGTANKSTVAQYLLTKLKNYAVALSWVTE